MKLSMRWELNNRGYELTEEPAPNHSVHTLLSIADPTIWIIPRQPVSPIQTQPLDIDALYARLAECLPTSEGALSFVDRFGLLRAGDREPVAGVCAAIEAARALIATRDAGDIHTLTQWMTEPGNAAAMALRPSLAPAAAVHSRRDRSPYDLILSPRDLYSAIFFQFFRDYTENRSLRKCARRGCGEWFQFGPGTRHRNTAVYCSPSCQHADAYRIRRAAQ